MSCVQKVFPSANVTPNCVNKYPVRVIIEANGGGRKQLIWQGDQRSLFGKYASKREAAQKDIVAKLEMYKECMEDSD